MEDKVKIITVKELDRGVCKRLVLEHEPWKSLEYTEEDINSIVSSAKNANIIQAVSDGEVAGFAIFSFGVLLGSYLRLIVVDDEYRARGVGKLLMDEFERQTFIRYPNAYLCVSDFNTGAIKFYEHIGYKIIGNLQALVVEGKGELLMRKTKGAWRSFQKNILTKA